MTARRSFSGSSPNWQRKGWHLEKKRERDGTSKIIKKTESIAGATSVWEYAYHPDRGWLTEVRKNGAVVETFDYDANGNRTSFDDFWGDGSASYDAQDRMLAYGEKSYAYTTNGELLTKTEAGESINYGYDVRGALLGVDLPDGIEIDYLVDASGRRIGKKVNGMLVKGWIYAGGLAPVAETDGAGNLTTTFVYGTKVNVPEYFVRGGTTYRIFTDHLGSVRLVVDAASGAISQRIDYDAFGRIILDTNPGFQPFGFAGGLYDQQTGLTRFGARDYDPETGRWTSKDPIGFAGGSAGLYEYCANDPVNRVDPSGTFDLADTPKWAENALEGLSNFSAGFGDSLTFGGTEKVRQYVGIDHVVDKCSGAYFAGEATEIGGELVLTAGSSVLRRAAAKIGQKALRAEVRQVTRGIARNKKILHHINPLKGHPGTAPAALFPTAGLPPGLHSGAWNVKLLTAAAHAAAHTRLRFLESGARILFHPAMTAARATRDILEGAECQ